MEAQDNTDIKAGGGTGKITWKLSNGTLIISGNKVMPNYKYKDDSSISTPWYPYRDFIVSIIIEDGVTSIGKFAFYGCKNLTSITIPKSVTKIGWWAFDNIECEKLRSINVDNDNPVYSSEKGILFDKVKTVLIQFPPTKTDRYYAIPKSVTKIDDNAFSKCANLAYIIIPDGVTSIGSGAFSHCYNLMYIVIPNGVKCIGFATFSNCESLISVTIPDSVTNIGWGAFHNCFSLKSITLPKGITEIGNGKCTFSECDFEHIYLQNEQPPTTDCNTFKEVDKETCVLHLPSGSKKRYANAEGWKEFKNIEEEVKIDIEKYFENSLFADVPLQKN